ncbi:hypothetical protein [Lactobacillus sp. ESL0681]|uniref:hypothetical protein n=1 Tax=Lactobacillus sp. ESL0681 TaxID=2983211 RepID=UPI0023F67833|nr:hypothetical protein [Lactobacillus sp. ESL0681]WEV40969.1 hypothetical protein OZX59_03355 [Lactobacillus sp. ESL0681]
MKKHKLFALLITFCALINTQANVQSVQAATYHVVKQKNYSKIKPYHAKDPDKSVKIWNKKHTKTIGNLQNYPHTTWYASASVTMKHDSTKAIYYKVKSGNKRHSGYVWHGYLTKGKYAATSTPTTTSVLFNPLNPEYGIHTKNIDNTLNNLVVSLFPNTIHDKQTQLAADLFDHYVIGTEDCIKLESYAKLNNQSDFKNFIYNQLKKELTKYNKTFTDFNGYKIGAYVDPKNKQTIVLLKSPESTPTKLPTVFYDPKNYAGVTSSEYIDTKRNDELISLFPGTIKNDQVQLADNLYQSYFDVSADYPERYDDICKDILGKNYKKKVVFVRSMLGWKDSTYTEGKSDEEIYEAAKKEIAKDLKRQHKNFDDFKGYKIGAYFCPSTEENNYGVTQIILVPPTVKLPKIGKCTFTIDDVPLD